jgi:very-short-patch-repair endonuclease
MSNGCLSLLTFGLLGRGKAAPQDSSQRAPDYPYGLRDDFLSAAEISFFHVLRSTLAPDVTIVIKPRLSDILFVRQPHINHGARNRIDRKHVDFLLCETATMTPRLVVELDDSSHQRQKTQERDELVDGALKAAGLPILHVRAAKGYAPQELFAQIQQAISGLPHV